MTLPVLVPETDVVPLTASVGVDVPEMATPLTLVGVMAPSVSVMAGVVLASATDPLTPLALTTETLVTVPPPPVVADNTPPVDIERPDPMVMGSQSPEVDELRPSSRLGFADGARLESGRSPVTWLARLMADAVSA